MRLLKLLLLLGLFILMFLWVRSEEDKIEKKINYSTETKFSNSDSIECDSTTKTLDLQPQ